MKRLQSNVSLTDCKMQTKITTTEQLELFGINVSSDSYSDFYYLYCIVLLVLMRGRIGPQGSHAACSTPFSSPEPSFRLVSGKNEGSGNSAFRML